MPSLSQRLQPLVSPALFDFWAGRLNPAWSWDRCLARVIARRNESRDAVTLVLQPNRHFKGFRAGQHVNVTAEVDGARITRSYSLSSVPQPGGPIAITVRRVVDGKLSSQLCLHTRIGDVLEIGPAFGAMTWPDEPEGRWLLLAAGSGITPLMSLLRDAAAHPRGRTIDLIYWAAQRSELCFAAELRELAARHPQFRVHFVLTREATLQDGEHAGRASLALLTTLVPDLARCRSYACGPRGFVDSLRALVGDRVARFDAEAFTPPTAPRTTLGNVRVELALSGRVLEVAAGESLLTALEAQGLSPAHGCRMGICNTCACGKRAGLTQDLVNGQFDAEPSAALRLCVSRAASDLILEL